MAHRLAARCAPGDTSQGKADITLRITVCSQPSNHRCRRESGCTSALVRALGRFGELVLGMPTVRAGIRERPFPLGGRCLLSARVAVAQVAARRTAAQILLLHGAEAIAEVG